MTFNLAKTTRRAGSYRTDITRLIIAGNANGDCETMKLNMSKDALAALASDDSVNYVQVHVGEEKNAGRIVVVPCLKEDDGARKVNSKGGVLIPSGAFDATELDVNNVYKIDKFKESAKLGGLMFDFNKAEIKARTTRAVVTD